MKFKRISILQCFARFGGIHRSDNHIEIGHFDLFVFPSLSILALLEIPNGAQQGGQHTANS